MTEEKIVSATRSDVAPPPPNETHHERDDGSTASMSTTSTDKTLIRPDPVERTVSEASVADSNDDGSSSNASSSRTGHHHHHHHHTGARHHIHVAHHHAAPHHHHYARAHPNMRGGAGRHRSAIGLMRTPSTTAVANPSNLRGGTTTRGHGRVASSSKMSHTSSTSTVTTDGSVHSASEDQEEDKSHAKDDGKLNDEVIPPSSPPKEGKKEQEKRRPPVTFTMGSMEDESDFEDEEEEERHNVQRAAVGAQKASAAEKRPQGPADLEEAVEGDSSGDWSSDTSEDPEEERRREEEKRRQQERERIDSMFKKIPIRSQSAADIRLLDPNTRPSNDVMAAPTAPARGLLSSIFHPEEQHHRHAKHASEGLAARRAHASAVDVAHMMRQTPMKERKIRKGSESSRHDDSTQSDVLIRAPSFGNLGVLGSTGGGLKMSKSAAALPVLSTLGSRTSAAAPPSTTSSTHAGHVQKRSSSTHRAVFAGDESDNEDRDDATLITGSSVAGASANSGSFAGGSAMDRLNELAQTRLSSKSRNGRPLSLRSSASEQDADRRRMSGGSSASVGAGNAKRTSMSSLDVQVRPDLEEDTIRQQRRTSMPFEAPAVSAPIHLPMRSKSVVNVPDVGLPQSPRTTRRNMLRDELSESLRQNLLWERQSRSRMLGLGTNATAATTQTGNAITAAPLSSQHADGLPSSSHHSRSSSAGRITSPTQQPHSHHHRPQSVLGGNALRPLTTRNSSSTSNSNRDAGRYTGDFHHTGW